MPKFRFVVPADSSDLRLDQCLARHVQPLSRRTAKLALDIGCVFVNKKRVKAASRRVREGDDIVAHLEGAYQRALTRDPDAPPRTPPLHVRFEDAHLVVLYKPAGVLTAPTPESDRNNLLYWLESRTERRQRHYVVHRLDLHTSGVLVFAKTSDANRVLSEMFRRHDLVRQYDVFVHGHFSGEPQRVEAPINGKHAITHLTLEKHVGHYSWLLATLQTGRTHQIRRHLSGVGFPVVADPKYGRTRSDAPRMGLHARRLAFAHPISGEQLDFQEPLPDDLSSWIHAKQTTCIEPNSAIRDADSSTEHEHHATQGD